MVYGRSFNEQNILSFNQMKEVNTDYSTIFFNKEGDIWKAVNIAVQYGIETKLIIKDEIRFKASVEEGLEKLKQFGKDKKVFIDCSSTDALQGMYTKSNFIEKYTIEDFDKSVAQLNLAFAKKRILLYNTCGLVKADIENFKFTKSKDENSIKYVTTKDGFVACLRIAMQYYGGIV